MHCNSRRNYLYVFFLFCYRTGHIPCEERCRWFKLSDYLKNHDLLCVYIGSVIKTTQFNVFFFNYKGNPPRTLLRALLCCNEEQGNNSLKMNYVQGDQDDRKFWLTNNTLFTTALLHAGIWLVRGSVVWSDLIWLSVVPAPTQITGLYECAWKN